MRTADVTRGEDRRSAILLIMGYRPPKRNPAKSSVQAPRVQRVDALILLRYTGTSTWYWYRATLIPVLYSTVASLLTTTRKITKALAL